MTIRDTGHPCPQQVQKKIFFPTAESGRLLEPEVAAARAVCAGCPVIEQCLEFARERLTHGIAGGLTPAERRAGSRRSRPRSVRPTARRRRSEAADAGRAALRAGRSQAAVAREFGVSDRTVLRWATANRAEATAGTAAGGTRATVGRGVA